MKMRKEIITRIAPSPTGNLHIGTTRTALFNFLFAKHNKGKFIIRVEDTDKKRSKKEYEENILEGLSWLGITTDDLYRQSERGDIYQKAIQELLDSEKAYLSKEPGRDDPDKEVEVVRLKNPGKKITFKDIIRGEVTFDTEELGDFVIARNINEPLYHLAVVVDDADMNISHVIRGEDHISNTPRQILIGEALGLEMPEYAHIPLILGPDRSKLSKRSGTAVSISEYQKMGYLGDALVNYLALLGWNPGTEQELFTFDELIKTFSLEKVQKGGAIFDTVKLDWFNAEYIKKLPPEAIISEIEERLPSKLKEEVGYSKERIATIAPILTERIHRLQEIDELIEEGELDYYFKTPVYKVEKLLPKKETDGAKIAEYLETIIQSLIAVPDEQFNREEIKSAVWDYASEIGRGLVLWPMRFALSGKERSPDPFILAEVLGKEETQKRLAHAKELLLRNEK